MDHNDLLQEFQTLSDTAQVQRMVDLGRRVRVRCAHADVSTSARRPVVTRGLRPPAGDHRLRSPYPRQVSGRRTETAKYRASSREPETREGHRR